MDIVITYVNGLDTEWQRQYAGFIGGNVNAKRFRDWDTLKYLLRGIENCMPEVGSVYLVVSGESQVPSWVNRDRLKVILHKDIIPERFLPVFNSTAIEMFLHRIPGLSEQWVYFNDDFFPVAPLAKEDFFAEGKAVIGYSRHCFVSNMYKRHCKSSDHLARTAARISGNAAPGRCGQGLCSAFFLRPQHCCAPMLRSSSEDVFRIMEKEILNSITRVRDARNYNQYLFTDYLFYTGRAVNRRMSNKHISIGTATAETLDNAISNPTCKMVCVNDVNVSDSKFETCRNSLLNAFDRRFPDYSEYEKHD